MSPQQKREPSNMVELEAAVAEANEKLPSQFFTLKATAELMGEVTPDGRPKYWHVARLIQSGALRARRVGKHYLVPGTAIIEFRDGRDEPMRHGDPPIRQAS